MSVGPKGQPLKPQAAGLSPSDMALYVKHVKAYMARLIPISGVPSSGRGRAGRALLRSARTSPVLVVRLPRPLFPQLQN